nr:hypothetical protein [Tanacetum cinerariifolium]
GIRAVTESSLRRNLKLKDEEGISSLPDEELFENLTLMGYNISPNQKFTFQKDVSQGEACPTDSGFEADQDRANIAKTSTLPHESTSKVTSLAADEGSIQHKVDELIALCTSLQRQQSEMVFRFEAQELKINSLKAKIKLLEDKDREVAEHSGDDALIKGRRLDVGEEAAKRVSDDTAEMATVLTSMDAATVLASGVTEVPTASGSIPTASPPATGVPTGSDVVPTVEIARIHAEEELQIMIDGLDRNNETVAKYLQEYHQFATELPIERRIELISDLVRYQDNYAKEEAERFKRKGLRFEQESAKKLKTSEEVPEEVKSPDEVPEEKVKEMMRLVPIKEVYVEALQVKQPIIDGKHLDREDLNQLWALVKESLNIRPTISDKEMELWVELKRLYEPDVEDQLWTHTQNMMYAPAEWNLNDSCGVHHVTSKDNEIFMLTEKDYPLRKGLAIMMICYKLQVENYSQMASDLILKIHKIANRPRQEDD